MRRVVAFVPARCGSKSIPLKNIKLFYGQPLIAWCLNALEASREISDVIVSTDCDDIAQTVESLDLAKVKIFRRSPEFAGDTASTEDAIMEFLQQARLPADDLFILIQATNPFLQAHHLDEGVRMIRSGQYDSVVSCALTNHFTWSASGQSLNYNYRDRPRRQDFDGTLIENGAFYISSVGRIIKNKNRLSGKIGIYEMPAYTMHELDEPMDWVIGEAIMSSLA